MQVVLLTLVAASASAPITSKNWRQHPLVVEVRREVEAINALEQGTKLTREERLGPECENYEGDMVRTIHRDPSKRIRMLVVDQGSEDSSVSLKHYYDESSRLRFVFITGGAVNGSKLEHRIYFDKAGKRVWETHEFVEGPGYTFPSEWPKEQLALDAEARWRRELPCEAKPK